MLVETVHWHMVSKDMYRARVCSYHVLLSVVRDGSSGLWTMDAVWYEFSEHFCGSYLSLACMCPEINSIGFFEATLAMTALLKYFNRNAKKILGHSYTLLSEEQTGESKAPAASKVTLADIEKKLIEIRELQQTMAATLAFETNNADIDVTRACAGGRYADEAIAKLGEVERRLSDIKTALLCFLGNYANCAPLPIALKRSIDVAIKMLDKV